MSQINLAQKQIKKVFFITLTVLLTNFGISNQAKAERRDNIDGKITNAVVCNNNNNYELKAETSISTLYGANPRNVKHNFKNRVQRTVNISGFWASTSPLGDYKWRPTNTDFNYSNVKNKTYKTEYWSFWGTELDNKTDFLLGNKIEMYNGKEFYDLGGVINFGHIAKGQCKTWNGWSVIQ